MMHARGFIARGFFFVALIAVVTATSIRPASATPIFAERYGFKCTQCHTVIPELNAFGEHFRRAGFNLPGLPRHAEFPLMLRVQETYLKDLQPSQTRRFNTLAIAVSTANFGPDRTYSYFARYFFGSQGAPGSLYYGWVQHVDPNTGVFERFGLFGLPLIENATQRLDTITPQSVYTYDVGHSDANLATPRYGVLLGRRNDRQDVELAVDFDEYHGAAYGAPTPPSDLAQRFSGPELFGSATFEIFPGFHAGALGLEGIRAFQSRTNSFAFSDYFRREGVQAQWSGKRFDVYAQQVWGRDYNTDGFGTAAESSGGFVTLKYRPTPHSYVGIRYDAAANPFATRDLAYYAAFAPTIHARLVIEHVQPIGIGQATTSAQLLFALPFEPKGAVGPP